MESYWIILGGEGILLLLFLILRFISAKRFYGRLEYKIREWERLNTEKMETLDLKIHDIMLLDALHRDLDASRKENNEYVKDIASQLKTPEGIIALSLNLEKSGYINYDSLKNDGPDIDESEGEI